MPVVARKEEKTTATGQTRGLSLQRGTRASLCYPSLLQLLMSGTTSAGSGTEGNHCRVTRSQAPGAGLRPSHLAHLLPGIPLGLPCPDLEERGTGGGRAPAAGLHLELARCFLFLLLLLLLCTSEVRWTGQSLVGGFR